MTEIVVLYAFKCAKCGKFMVSFSEKQLRYWIRVHSYQEHYEEPKDFNIKTVKVEVDI